MILERKKQLLDLGFDENPDQQSFIYSLDSMDSHIYIDFWELTDEIDDVSWNVKIHNAIKDIHTNNGIKYN